MHQVSGYVKSITGTDVRGINERIVAITMIGRGGVCDSNLGVR